MAQNSSKPGYDTQPARENTFSTQEARKIIGVGSQNLTDAQIQDIILTLNLLAKQYICYNGSKKVLGK